MQIEFKTKGLIQKHNEIDRIEEIMECGTNIQSINEWIGKESKTQKVIAR